MRGLYGTVNNNLLYHALDTHFIGEKRLKKGSYFPVKVYISASWKKREEVRTLANKLRKLGHEVFDFTDHKRRNAPEIPPEKFPEQFNPEKHNYHDYLDWPEFRFAMRENYQAIAWSDLIILLLPCGQDATADWALGVGMGKRSIIVGNPGAGVRCPTHLWADVFSESIDDVVQRLG
jgi:hypothetical protein